MDSHITESELDALQTSTLHRSNPYMIQGVSHGQLSIARHYGGCKFQGDNYTYVPTTDELIRDDVVKFLAKHRANEKKFEQKTEELF